MCSQTFGDHSSCIILQDYINDATYKRDWTLLAQSITRTGLKLGIQQVPMTFLPIGGG